MSELTNIRIVDIARKAGVSAGTVDRVIHNRGRVSQTKRELVERALAEMNYEPNMAARFLASKKRYSIAIVIPVFSEGQYWALVHHGMERAWDELRRYNIDIRYFFFDQYNAQSFIALIDEVSTSAFDGVVMATLTGEPAIELSRNLDLHRIPYIYIDANIAHQNNLAYFGCDSFSGGAMAARLLLNEVGRDASLFFAHIRYHNRPVSVQMTARQKGFESYLQSIHYQGEVFSMDLYPDDHCGNVSRLQKLIKHSGKQLGGMVFNSGIHELVKVVESLEDQDKRRIHLGGYDAIDKNVLALRHNEVAFLLSQRPEIQGYDAVKALGNHFLFGQITEKMNFMPIDILISENIEFYHNYKL